MRSLFSLIVGLFCSAVTLAALPSVGQEADEFQIFPVVARTAGAHGSQWVSDLSVHNYKPYPMEVGVQFFPADQGNVWDPAFPNRFHIAAGETILFPDVLSAVFGIADDAKGILVLTVEPELIPENPQDAQILAVTRTYNKVEGGGTYGQTVPSLLIALSASPDLPLMATGARHDAAYRSNLGVASFFFEAITVHYRIFAADGAVLSEGVKDMPRGTLKQWSFTQLGVPPTEGPLTAHVWIDPGDALDDPCGDDTLAVITAYVSKVDNTTGDAEYLLASPPEEYGCEDN